MQSSALGIIVAILVIQSHVIEASSKVSSNDISPGLIYEGFISTDAANPSEIRSDFSQVSIITSNLQALKVNARIIDGIAEVSMTQQFRTPTFFPDNFVLKEAAYQIPLDELAAVTEFRAQVGDRIIEAVVKERADAREEYEKAIEEGKNAYLAEQMRADIFRISVGNIPIGKLVKVTLVYITSLETIDEDTVRFIFPTGITPRYSPLDNSEEAIADGLDIMEQGINIQLDVLMATEILTTSSNTHSIDVNYEKNNTKHAMVQVTDEDPQKRDLVVEVTTKSNYEPQIYLESSPKYGSVALMLSIVPNISQPLLETRVLYEYVFIIDRSGSMSGHNIDQTRQAMSYILDRIPNDSIFNIIGFGSEFVPLFEEGSRSILDENAKSVAQDYINKMDADFGGTEILSPLRYVLDGESMPTISTHERIILIITDGAVSNTDDTIEYVQKHNSNGRVFALGIGDHVSALLVRGLARAGRGTAEFVDGDNLDSIEDAVERQMFVASLPALTDVVIQWGNLEQSVLSQAPFITPNLLVGKRFLIFLVVEDIQKIPEFAKITSSISNTDKSIVYKVNSTSYLKLATKSNELNSNLIHKMACRSLIRDLEEGGSALHFQNGTTIDDVNNEIVRLGLKYQIVSSQTSFVAVDNTGWTESQMAPLEWMADNSVGGMQIKSFHSSASSTHWWCGINFFYFIIFMTYLLM